MKYDEFGVLYSDNGDFLFILQDDGTLDTVVEIAHFCGTSWEFRYGDTSDFRDEDGTLNFESWVEDVVLHDVMCGGCPECDG